MKKILALYTVLIISLLTLSCGSKKTDDQPETETQSRSEITSRNSNEPAQRHKKGTLTKDDVMATNPNRKDEAAPPKPVIPKGPLTVPENMREGSCEYTAYWFAEYFTSGDSINAYQLCTDSMKNIVRKILQTPGQIKTMQLNRQAGYTINGVSIADESTGTECRACLQATHLEETREDCNFHFEKINGKWLLSAFKKK